MEPIEPLNLGPFENDPEPYTCTDCGNQFTGWPHGAFITEDPETERTLVHCPNHTNGDEFLEALSSDIVTRWLRSFRITDEMVNEFNQLADVGPGFGAYEYLHSVYADIVNEYPDHATRPVNYEPPKWDDDEDDLF